jgi:Ca-activated chloride channel family protein
MLTWGIPEAFIWSLSILPVILLYFLRMRFRRQPISSIYIWSRLKQFTDGATRINRRSVLLLFLQILAILAATIALAQPSWIIRRLEPPGALVFIDISASMSALDGEDSRLERAKSLAIQQIEQLPEDRMVMVFLCGSDAHPLGEPTSDKRQLIRRLDLISQQGTSFSEKQVTGTVKAWLEMQERIWTAWLITDGGLDLGGRLLASLFGGELQVLDVGNHGHNVGVTGLRVLKNEAAFQIVNGWPESRQITVRLEYNDQLLKREQIKVEPGISRHTIQCSLQENKEGLYVISLEEKDMFLWDNRYTLALNPLRRIRVLSAGPANPFLRAALNHPGVILTEKSSIMPEDIETNMWDLIIADQVEVPAGVNTHLLTFGSLPPDAPAKFGEKVSGLISNEESGHPLIRYVDFKSQVAQGYEFQIDSGVQTLATIDGLPVIIAWEKDGRRNAAWGTSLLDSDLGLSGAFPIFLQNMLAWCVPHGNNPLAYTLLTGKPEVYLESPDWRAEGKGFDIVRKGQRVVVKTDFPGTAVWRQRNQRGILAANLPVRELDLAPRRLGGIKDASRHSAEYSSRRTSLTSWPILLLLVFLVFEWLVWRGWRPELRKRGGRHVVG